MARNFGQAKLDKFKQIFQQRINEILSRANVDEELDVEGDEVDIIQGAVIHDMSQRLSLRDADTLKKLKIAMQRIEAGTFGKCSECDRHIGEKRLLAMPGCDLCIDCAEEEERQAKRAATT